MREKVSITLDKDIVEQIKELEEQDDRPFSQYINMVIRQRLIKGKSSELFMNMEQEKRV